MRAALRAGAAVEFVDGKVVAQPPAPAIEVKPPAVTVPESRKPEEAPPRRRPVEEQNPHYVAMKEFLGKAGVDSHVSHVSASLSVLLGVRLGTWQPGTDALKRFASEHIDVAMLAQCCTRAISLKHTIKVRNKRISLSTAALGAAMYAAMDQDAHLTLDAMEPVIAGTAMERKAKELANEADKYGGPRTIEYRRVSYKEFLAILTQKEI